MLENKIRQRYTTAPHCLIREINTNADDIEILTRIRRDLEHTTRQLIKKSERAGMELGSEKNNYMELRQLTKKTTQKIQQYNSKESNNLCM